jgi:hypothetical protein
MILQSARFPSYFSSLESLISKYPVLPQDRDLIVKHYRAGADFPYYIISRNPFILPWFQEILNFFNKKNGKNITFLDAIANSSRRPQNFTHSEPKPEPMIESATSSVVNTADSATPSADSATPSADSATSSVVNTADSATPSADSATPSAPADPAMKGGNYDELKRFKIKKL